MGTFENHRKLYENFKKDAEKEDNFEVSRVELFFLSIFHLIEACAALKRIHIDKHQRLRKILDENDTIFKDQTDRVWRWFQEIENRFRPKFTYGSSWSTADFLKIKELYSKLESICLKIIEGETQ